MSERARPEVILASASPYRRQQLAQLKLPHRAIAANVDETALAHESGLALAARLAEKKARSIALLAPGALVIGCDQTMVCDALIYGKPHTVVRANEMLRAFSGRTAVFHSALVLVRNSELLGARVIDTQVQFRDLDDSTIARYLALEPALDCAGGFKSESLGIALVQSIHSDDPSALIGLPCIALLQMLRAQGICPLT